MEIIINKEEFLKGLHRTQGVIEKRHTMPILSNLLISTTEGKIEISATDLDIGIKDFRVADIIKEGSTTVNARKLYEIVREMPEEKIAMKTKENNWLEIKSGKATFNIAALPSEEFPSLPKLQVEAFYKIASPILKDMIDMTIFAASQDETRRNINGIFFKNDKNDNTLIMVATDGHRLAFVCKENIDVSGLDEGVIIPKKGLSEVKRLIEDEGEDEIEIGFSENSLIVKTNSTDLVIRLLEGEFPGYREVIPEGNGYKLSIKKDKLLSTLKRMAILSSDRYKGLRLNLSPGNLEITSNNPDLGEAQEEIDVDYSGENIEVTFNTKYLIDGINAIINEDRVVLELKDSSSAGVISPMEKRDYLYILMPMRL